VNQLSRLFQLRWIISTILVIVAMGIMIRLGIWQLDRLESRRAFNNRVLEQINQPRLLISGQELETDIAHMEYRQVSVSGEYDHAHQVALRNQHWDNQWGVHLVTPLRIQNSDQYILVDRGWIPSEEYLSGDWSKFDESGLVHVEGVIRASQSQADFGNRSDPIPEPGMPVQNAWTFINIDALQAQSPYPFLGAYIQQAPNQTWEGMPIRTQPDIEITEGPHFGYAIQWFSFAAVLGIGYVFYLRNQWKPALNNLSGSEKINLPVTNEEIG
jgi:surfeit locus 1 family protein